ncbi:MAG TPA: hypothetical protein ENI99_04015 [Sedimenticola sp.]|nr:hypothetical protein [Sedimenticola sp.]
MTDDIHSNAESVSEATPIETLCEQIGEQRIMLFKATGVLEIMAKSHDMDSEHLEDAAAVVAKLIGEINDALDHIETDLRAAC